MDEWVGLIIDYLGLQAKKARFCKANGERVVSRYGLILGLCLYEMYVVLETFQYYDPQQKKRKSSYLKHQITIASLT